MAWNGPFSVLFLAFCISGDVASQGIPAQSPPKSGSQFQLTLQPLLTGKYRLLRDSQTIVISQGQQKITVEYFTDLVVGNIIAEKLIPETLEGNAITVMRDPKQKDRWTVCLGGPSGGEDFIMADNVFKVRKALISTVQKPVKIQLDGKVYRLQPGEVLLLLG